MKKKVLQRGLFGIPTGIAIGYVITVMMSAFWGDGSYYPCVPAFVDAMGSEVRAVVVQAVLGGLVGMVYAGGSVVWEVDRWSLAGQTAAYFLITLGSVLPVAYAALNMVCPHTGQSSFTGTSQVMKSHRALSSAALSRSQQ